MIKGLIQEEDTTIANISAPNTEAPQYIRQTLTDIKGDIDSNTITAGDFNTPLTPMDRSSKQKINKETQGLNDALDEMDLIDIFRTFHPNTEHYTFSSAHGTFSRIDHVLGHKSNLSKFKKIEIIWSIFSNHNAMRWDINYKKKTARNRNTWRLSNMFLNNQRVTEEIKREIKNFWKQMTMKTPQLKTYGMQQKQSWGKLIAIQLYIKKQDKHWIDSLTLHLKQLEKEEQKNPKSSRKERNHKDLTWNKWEKNERNISKDYKTKSWFFEKINKMDRSLARLIKK